MNFSCRDYSICNEAFILYLLTVDGSVVVPVLSPPHTCGVEVTVIPYLHVCLLQIRLHVPRLVVSQWPVGR